MKIVITGGHFAPAYALIQKLKEDNKLVLIGRRHAQEGDNSDSFEYRLSEKLGITFINLKTGRLTRRVTKHTFTSFFQAPIGFSRALAILKKEKPDVVVSFGGYISLPVCLAAKLLSIPIVIHEQTQGAGMANKYVGKIATRVCISFESSRNYFPESKVVLTGLPVRSEVTEVVKAIKIDDKKPLIYITGGSTGSHAINELVEHSIHELLESYSVIHQTGESKYHDFERLEKVWSSLTPEQQARYVIKRYVYPDEIGWIFKNAEIIVGRAGINTVNEIVTMHKKALLIPLPHGQTGEQKANAQLVEKAQLGYYIDQDSTTPQDFIQALQKVSELKFSKADISDIQRPTEKIIEVIRSVVRR